MSKPEKIEWHLPTHKQLKSLLWLKLSKGQIACACMAEIQTHYAALFPFPHDWYWSSSVNKSNQAKVIDFRDGFSGRCATDSQSQSKGRVRLVASHASEATWRDGMPAEQRYTLFNDTAVIDNKTGLIWKRTPSDKVRYCDVAAHLPA